jgi:hypothetical protein
MSPSKCPACAALTVPPHELRSLIGAQIDRLGPEGFAAAVCPSCARELRAVITLERAERRGG